jgi:hypothetical protein
MISKKNTRQSISYMWLKKLKTNNIKIPLKVKGNKSYFIKYSWTIFHFLFCILDTIIENNC